MNDAGQRVVTETFSLPYWRFATGIPSALSRLFERAGGPQNTILPSSQVNAAPLPTRWGEGKDPGVGRVRPSGIDHRKCSIPSPHRMGRGLGRGAMQLSAAAFRLGTVTDWLRYSRLKVCATPHTGHLSYAQVPETRSEQWCSPAAFPPSDGEREHFVQTGRQSTNRGARPVLFPFLHRIGGGPR